MNLDALEAKARALKEATERWATSLVDVSLPGATTEQRTRHEANVAAFEDAEKAYADAFGFDAVLDLIERVRAGERLRSFIAMGNTTRDFAAAVADFDRLAHSPQEAV